MLVLMKELALIYSESFGCWLLQMFRWVKKDEEIVITGTDLDQFSSNNFIFLFLVGFCSLPLIQ
jgi:hypothetical protein